jgi:hypothetical protein
MEKKTVIVHVLGKGENCGLRFDVPAGINPNEFIGLGYSVDGNSISCEAIGSEWALAKEKERLAAFFNERGYNVEYVAEYKGLRNYS